MEMVLTPRILKFATCWYPIRFCLAGRSSPYLVGWRL